jgi:RimJ/RimL family protein N-acetyltransferase
MRRSLPPVPGRVNRCERRCSDRAPVSITDVERAEDPDPARPPSRGPRLVLEPLRLGHQAELAPLLADRGLHAFTGGEPDSPAELHARIARQVRGRSPDGRDVWMNWVLRDGAAAVGTVQATLRPDRVAEVAWVVFRPFQGRGYAREAAIVLVEWLLASGAADAVVAHIHPDHAASAAVARAAGLERTDEWHDGERRWRAHTQRVW